MLAFLKTRLCLILSLFSFGAQAQTYTSIGAISAFDLNVRTLPKVFNNESFAFWVDSMVGAEKEEVLIFLDAYEKMDLEQKSEAFIDFLEAYPEADVYMTSISADPTQETL